MNIFGKPVSLFERYYHNVFYPFLNNLFFVHWFCIGGVGGGWYKFGENWSVIHKLRQVQKKYYHGSFFLR